MGIRWIRIGVGCFFLLYLLVVTWPLGTLSRGAEPFVLGLPFSFFWYALWIALGGAALALLDRAEEMERRRRGSGDRSGAGSSGAPP